MIELEKEFYGKGEVKDFCFNQIYFDGNIYIYSVAFEGKVIHYEVFLRKETREANWDTGSTVIAYEPKVRYPKGEAFGNWAFTCFTEEEIKQRIKRLKRLLYVRERE